MCYHLLLFSKTKLNLFCTLLWIESKIVYLSGFLIRRPLNNNLFNIEVVCQEILHSIVYCS